MNGLYTILLFLFVFGAVTQGFNELGLFTFNLPTSPNQVPNYSTVTNMQSGAESTPLNAWNTIQMILSMMKVIGAGVIAMFWIAPIITPYFTLMGINAVMAGALCTMIQAPLTIIAIVGLYEWWTGRSVT